MALKKHLLRMSLILTSLSLSACGPDLGVFEKEDGYESYYKSFGKVKGLYEYFDEEQKPVPGEVEYDISKSLFNSTTVEKGSWEKEEYEVKELEYLYIILPFKDALKIENIALYVYSPVSITMKLSTFYYVNEDAAPKNIKYRNSPDTEPEYDDDDNYIGEKEIEYDDPKIEDSMLTYDIPLINKEWKSFVFYNFKQEGYEDGYLHTGDEGLLYIRIENNSGWNRDTMDTLQFKFINLIIRAI